MAAGLHAVADHGVLAHADQAAGLADADPLGDVLQQGDDLVLGQAGVKQGRALTLGEAGLAGAAVEQPELMGLAVMAADGQVTLGAEVLKSSARKLRRLFNERIVAGFAGSTADAFSLFARFESKLEQFNGNLSRSVVEMAKDWRTDKILRHLEALLLVADAKNIFILSGNGVSGCRDRCGRGPRDCAG